MTDPSADLLGLGGTQVMVPSTDGVTVSAWDFRTAGSADRPVVLFSHATGFHSRVWDPLIAALGDDIAAVSVDLRGHGDTVVPGGADYEWFGMAQDLLAVIDALDLGDVRGVGHSMGGASLLRAEAERPGTMSRAWLFEPIVFPAAELRPGESSLVEGARRRREIFPTRDDVFERYMSRPPFNVCDPDMVRRYVDYGFVDIEDDDGAPAVRIKCRGAVEAQVFNNAGSGLWEMLDQVATQVTVLGSGDGAVPSQFAEPAANELTNGTYEFHDDLTHFGPFVAIEAMAASIRTALHL